MSLERARCEARRNRLDRAGSWTFAGAPHLGQRLELPWEPMGRPGALLGRRPVGAVVVAGATRLGALFDQVRWLMEQTERGCSRHSDRRRMTLRRSRGGLALGLPRPVHCRGNCAGEPCCPIGLDQVAMRHGPQSSLTSLTAWLLGPRS